MVLVADGLAKISKSAQQYLCRTFKLTDAALVSEGPPWREQDQIFISHPVVLGPSGSKFCLLLKHHNHKKINSACKRELDRPPWTCPAQSLPTL